MTDKKEMTYEQIVKANEAVYAKITEHTKAIDELKAKILPVPNAPTVNLVGSNKNALEQRKAAHAKRAEEKKAIEAALVIAEQQKKAKKAK